MTVLGPNTIKAIEDHKRNMRLRQENERQIRKMVRDGYGVYDLMQSEGPSKPWKLGLSYEAARAAVFGRGK